MDIVERIKIEVRQKNWLESIRRQQESGMDVKEWCLQEKISRSTYYYRLIIGSERYGSICVSK